MSVSGYRVCLFELRHQIVVSLSKTHHRIALIDSAVSLSPGGNNLAQGYSVQRDFLSNITYNHAIYLFFLYTT